MPDTPLKIIKLDSCQCHNIKSKLDFTLDPDERVGVALDLENELPSGVTVASVAHIITDLHDNTVVTGTILATERVYNNANSIDVGAYAVLHNAVLGHIYKVEATITLSDVDAQVVQRVYCFQGKEK